MDIIPGGKADRIPDSRFNQHQLQMGQKIEREHTRNPKLAREIATDHLQEFPHYYTALHKMEKGLEDKRKSADWGDMDDPGVEFSDMSKDVKPYLRQIWKVGHIKMAAFLDELEKISFHATDFTPEERRAIREQTAARDIAISGPSPKPHPVEVAQQDRLKGLVQRMSPLGSSYAKGDYGMEGLAPEVRQNLAQQFDRLPHNPQGQFVGKVPEGLHQQYMQATQPMRTRDLQLLAEHSRGVQMEATPHAQQQMVQGATRERPATQTKIQALSGTARVSNPAAMAPTVAGTTPGTQASPARAMAPTVMAGVPRTTISGISPTVPGKLMPKPSFFSQVGQGIRGLMKSPRLRFA